MGSSPVLATSNILKLILVTIMTDRQFVKTHYPNAHLDYTCSATNRYRCWYNVMTAPWGTGGFEIIGRGLSAKTAWKSAKNNINTNILASNNIVT